MPNLPVIIADRDRDLRSALRVQLDAIGFTCFVAMDAHEAIERAARHPPGLVLLDTALHDLGGYEACAAIRRLADCRDTPIVLVSTIDRPQIRAAAIRAGASLVLVKPFSVSDLLRALEPFRTGVDGPAAWQPFADGSACPASGFAEPPRQVWGPPAKISPLEPRPPQLEQGLHMLAVMRRREAKQAGP